MTNTLVLIARAEKQGAVLLATLAAIREEFVGGQQPSQATIQRLSEFLLAYRQTHGISQAKMAQRIDLSGPTLRNLERRRHWPSRATLDLLLQWSELPEDLRSALRPISTLSPDFTEAQPSEPR